MMRRGILRAAVYVHAHKTCASGAAAGTGNISGTARIIGARAWLSATPGGESHDDPTPPETKLAFASAPYDKDPAAAAELTAEEAAAAENLKREAEKAGQAGRKVAASKGHDARAMFDSSLSQQADDGKASGDIKRDVAADTPDATRVAFRASAYGKDPHTAATLSEEEAAAVEALKRAVVWGSGGAAAAAPVHDGRNMFDSEFTQDAGDMRASDTIKRDVATDTPKATRVAFRASVYGKDPQSAAEHSKQEAAELEALRSVAARGAGRAGGAAAPVHDDRSMFDSDLTHGVGSAPSSDSIKRRVAADTPEATRLVFGGSDYGKDPNSMTRTDETQAEIEALAAKAMSRKAGAGTHAAAAAPIHDDRSMYDSELTQGSGAVSEFSAIKRDVTAGTPDMTRLAFKASVYGKDTSLAAQNHDGAHADLQKLREQSKAKGKEGESEEVGATRPAHAPVHHDRSMFDSDLTLGGGDGREYGSIKRHVAADTPALTRLSFFASTCEYGVSL